MYGHLTVQCVKFEKKPGVYGSLSDRVFHIQGTKGNRVGFLKKTAVQDGS